MPASRSEKAAETRKNLIDTARKSFSENGYKGTTVRKISKSIDVSESLLYHYFPNGKRELFAEVMKEELEAFRREVPNDEAFKMLDSLLVQDALDIILTRILEFVRRHIDIIRIIILEKEVREFLHAEEMCRFMDGVDCFFEKFLRKRLEKGEIRDIDIESAALFLKGLLLNRTLLFILGVDVSNEISSEKLKEIILRFFK